MYRQGAMPYHGNGGGATGVTRPASPDGGGEAFDMNCPGCVDVNYVDVDTERQDDAERAANTTPTIAPFVELVCEVKNYTSACMPIRAHRQLSWSGAASVELNRVCARACTCGCAGLREGCEVRLSALQRA